MKINYSARIIIHDNKKKFEENMLKLLRSVNELNN